MTIVFIIKSVSINSNDNEFNNNNIYLQLVNHGNLLNDFSPAVNPPAEIEDVNDRKPEDWDEREKVTDSGWKLSIRLVAI